MASRKTAVTAMQTHWSYCRLALSHRNVPTGQPNQHSSHRNVPVGEPDRHSCHPTCHSQARWYPYGIEVQAIKQARRLPFILWADNGPWLTFVTQIPLIKVIAFRGDYLGLFQEESLGVLPPIEHFDLVKYQINSLKTFALQKCLSRGRKPCSS